MRGESLQSFYIKPHLPSKLKHVSKNQRTRSRINTPANPRMEIVVSITVHDRKVCFSERLKNSLNIQNPESLIWDPKTLPVPMASTISSGETTPEATKGVTTPAAVMPATVADPIATLNRAVITQPKNQGSHLPFTAK